MKNQLQTMNGQSSSDKSEAVMARAKYKNIADSPDELSFGQGDIVTILEKNYDGLDGWWLCQLHGEVGLVPANYFDIVDPVAEDSIPLYDVPPNNRVAPSSSVYPLAVSTSSPAQQRDVKVTEATLGSVTTHVVLYDLPPSGSPPGGETARANGEVHARSSTPISNRSSPNRLSPNFASRSSPQLQQAAQHSEGTRLSNGSTMLYDTPPVSRKASASADPYDFPPDARKEAALQLYDTPRSNSPTKQHIPTDRLSIMPISMDCLFDEDADKLLESLHKNIGTAYGELCECVYGPDAVWDKDRRQPTMQRTINAVIRFDQSLVSFLEFGKGVSNVLETFKDTHLRMKFTESYACLLQKRLEILSKYDLLIDGREIVDPITTTVKTLLEIAKTLPGAATELEVLIRANKTILFKQQPRARSASSLPRPNATKAKLTVEPLNKAVLTRSISAASTEYNHTSLDRKVKRNPKDVLPPLPLELVSPQEQKTNLQKAKSYMTDMLTKKPNRDYEKLDNYDDLRWDQKRQTASSTQPARDSHISLNSVGSENDETDCPDHQQFHSDDTESLESGYFSFDYTPTTLERRNSSPKLISKQDQQLLGVFAMQLDAMSLTLVDSIDSFLSCAGDAGSTSAFVPQSKYTIVCAYKMVYVVNTLFQKITHGPTKLALSAASNELVEAIKLVVADTKAAVLQHQDPQSLQRVIESINNLNPVASDLVKVTRTCYGSPTSSP